MIYYLSLLAFVYGCGYFVYFTLFIASRLYWDIEQCLGTPRGSYYFNIRKSIFEIRSVFLKPPKRLQFTANTLLAHTFRFLSFFLLPYPFPSSLASISTSFFRFFHFFYVTPGLSICSALVSGLGI